jgi:hypothetical protein
VLMDELASTCKVAMQRLRQCRTQGFDHAMSIGVNKA